MTKLTAAGSLGVTDSTVAMGTGNAATVGVEVSGTWTGTITFETRIGSTWENAQTLTVAEADAAATLTANARRLLKVAGRSEVRARFSTATSGAPYIQFAGTESPLSATAGTQIVSGPDAGSAAETGNSVSIGFVGTGATHRNVTAANSVDATTGDDIPGFGPLIWNGTTWKRMLGNTRGEATVLSGGLAPAAPTCTFTRPADTTPYTIGDAVGTAGTAPTTVSVGRFNGAGGVIQGARVVYSNAPSTTPSLVVMLFSATVTMAADNAQLALSDAHALLCIGFIPLTSSQDGSYSAGARATSGNLILAGAPAAPLHFVCGASEQTIYAALITLNAFTPIANSETLTLTLEIEQN